MREIERERTKARDKIVELEEDTHTNRGKLRAKREKRS